MPANLENSAMATGLEKVSFIPIPKKGNAKECSNYCTIAHISHANKVMLKILQARLQQYVNQELPGSRKLDLEKNIEKFNTISAVSWFERDYYKIWTKLVEVMAFQLSYFKT